MALRNYPVICCIAACALAGYAAPRAATADDAAQETVIPMTTESGSVVAGKQDTRVFQIPVTVSGTKSNFIWSCGGQCIVSQAFAKLAILEVADNPDLAQMTDAAGQPLFIGDAPAEIVIAGKAHAVTVWVMRDTKYNKGMTGTIGYDIARQYQWEVDPSKPSLTLRPLGTEPKAKPLATLPLKEDQTNFWVTIKIRNAEDEVCLMPQTPDLQISPALQHKWDLEGGGHKTDAQTYLGNVRIQMLQGRDVVAFTDAITETNVPAYLLSESPNARSGLGQSLLNRFVYSVDAQRKEFNLFRHLGQPATRPSKTVRP